jgi:hypothetical protein
MKSRSAVCAVALALLLVAGSAVASNEEDSKSDQPPEKGNACIFFSTLYNWQVINDSSLVVWTDGDRDAYLVTLAFPAHDLPFAVNLGFDDADGNGLLCPYGGDSVLVRSPGSPNRFIIESIIKLSKTRLDDLLSSHKDTMGERHHVEEKPEHEKPAS